MRQMFAGSTVRSVLLVLLVLWVPASAQAQPEGVPPETVPIVPRSTWLAAPSDPTRMAPQTVIREIVVHHSDGRAPGPDLEAKVLQGIQSYHMDEKKWGDIAYHFLIAPSGRVFEGRSPVWAGDSATRYQLEGKLLICLLGSYDKAPPTDAALRALARFVRYQQREFDVPSSRVRGHRDYAETDCPGRYLSRWLESFRKFPTPE